MECTKEALEDLIRERYGSVPAMAKAIGKSAQTIYTCLNNLLIGSHFTTSLPIIEALDLDPFELLAGRVVFRSKRDRSFVNVPLYAPEHIGLSVEGASEEDLVPIPAEKHAQFPNAFLMRVSGRAMNLAFPEGTYVLVDPVSTVEFPGDPYVVRMPSGEAIINRVFPLANGLELHPFSSDLTMKSVVFDYDAPDGAGVSPVGRVVWAAYPLDWKFDSNAR